MIGSCNLDLALILERGPDRFWCCLLLIHGGLRQVIFKAGAYRVGEVDVNSDSPIVELRLGAEDQFGNFPITYTTENGGGGTVQISSKEPLQMSGFRALAKICFFAISGYWHGRMNWLHCLMQQAPMSKHRVVSTVSTI